MALTYSPSYFSPQDAAYVNCLVLIPKWKPIFQEDLNVLYCPRSTPPPPSPNPNVCVAHCDAWFPATFSAFNFYFFISYDNPYEQYGSTVGFPNGIGTGKSERCRSRRISDSKQQAVLTAKPSQIQQLHTANLECWGVFVILCWTTNVVTLCNQRIRPEEDLPKAEIVLDENPYLCNAAIVPKSLCQPTIPLSLIDP